MAERRDVRLTTATRTVAALVLVATATGLGLLTDAHLTMCALMMLVAVLFSAVLGPWPATVGAVTGLAALTGSSPRPGTASA